MTQPQDTPTSHTPGTDEGQRAALDQAEKKAAAGQPGSYKDRETEEKIVEVGPELTDAPIEGLDPSPKRENIEKP